MRDCWLAAPAPQRPMARQLITRKGLCSSSGRLNRAADSWQKGKAAVNTCGVIMCRSEAVSCPGLGLEHVRECRGG